MSRRSDMTSGAPAKRVDTARALRDAAATALLAFGLFLPLVGFETITDVRNDLILTTRWPLLLAVVAVIGAGRLAYTMIIEPRLRLRALRSPAPTQAWHLRGARWFAPFAIGFVVAYPAIVIATAGFGRAVKWIDNFGIQILIYVMLGWGLNIVVGLAGLLDLGYVAFYAVGAYTFAKLSTEFGWSFWACLPLAGMLAATFGICLGFPVLRLRGDYLAIVTLGFGEMVRIVLINWQSFTGGPAGIGGIAKMTFFGVPFEKNPAEGVTSFHTLFGLEFSVMQRIIFLYYVILVLALITNFFTIRLRRLPIGRAWEALREDETACRALGINPTNTKLTAFAMGAMFAGFAGSFFAVRNQFISPESFVFLESAVILAIVVLGGLGSQIGIVLATVALIGLPELFRELKDYRMLAFGIGMVLIMIWRPGGLMAHREPTIRLHDKGCAPLLVVGASKLTVQSS